jgi:hypothetical protein
VHATQSFISANSFKHFLYRSYFPPKFEIELDVCSLLGDNRQKHNLCVGMLWMNWWSCSFLFINPL